MGIQNPYTDKNVIFDAENSQFVEVGSLRFFEIRAEKFRAEVDALKKSLHGNVVDISIRKKISVAQHKLDLTEVSIKYLQ